MTSKRPFTGDGQSPRPAARLKIGDEEEEVDNEQEEEKAEDSGVSLSKDSLGDDDDERHLAQEPTAIAVSAAQQQRALTSAAASCAGTTELNFRLEPSLSFVSSSSPNPYQLQPRRLPLFSPQYAALAAPFLTGLRHPFQHLPPSLLVSDGRINPGGHPLGLATASDANATDSRTLLMTALGGAELAPPPFFPHSSSSPRQEQESATSTAGGTSATSSAVVPQLYHVAAAPVAAAPAAVSGSTNTSAAMSEQTRRRLTLEMEYAIQAMPLETKKAFLEAKVHCLKVCKAEANYFTFLRRCDFNVSEAAGRLCLYWKHRKDIFGDERAFLPMIMTGDGALTREDTLTLRAGFPAVLPEASNGQKVVFIDRTQFIPNATTNNRLRCLFYLSRVLADDERTQTDEGAPLWLVLVASPRLRDADREFVNRCSYLVEKVFPIRPVYHLLNKLGSSTSTTRLFTNQDLVVNYIEALLEHGVEPENVHVHFEREQGEVLDALLELGLTREGVPTIFGGTYTFVHAAEWCRSQQAREREKHKMDMVIALRRQEDRSEAAAVGSLKSSGDDEPNQQVKDQKIKRRERNLIYSRRKRDRRRQEQADLQEDHDQLAGEQEALLAEHMRLTHLLQQAQQIAATIESRQQPGQTQQTTSRQN